MAFDDDSISHTEMRPVRLPLTVDVGNTDETIASPSENGHLGSPLSDTETLRDAGVHYQMTSPTATGARGSEDSVTKAKQNVSIAAQGVTHQDWPSQDSHTARPEPRTWKLTIMRFGPLSGLFCICLAMASIIAALGILVGSRNSPTAEWRVEPSAYLAIFTAIANQSMRYACVQGVAIAWWSGALHGSNIKQLHRSWRSGTTVGGAVIAGRHMGLLGLACIFSTLVAVDGPLLQRATRVVPAPIAEPPVILNVTMAQEVPTSYFGG